MQWECAEKNPSENVTRFDHTLSYCTISVLPIFCSSGLKHNKVKTKILTELKKKKSMQEKIYGSLN